MGINLSAAALKHCASHILSKAPPRTGAWQMQVPLGICTRLQTVPGGVNSLPLNV